MCPAMLLRFPSSRPVYGPQGSGALRRGRLAYDALALRPRSQGLHIMAITDIRGALEAVTHLEISNGRGNSTHVARPSQSQLGDLAR